MAKATKLYAAYKAGYLGENILETYFSFVANMIFEENLTIIEDGVIKSKFEKRYSIEVSLTFMRQVLGVGVKNGSFVEYRGRYNVVRDEIKKYLFDETKFNFLWERLIKEFEVYCQEKDINMTTCDTSEFILNILDDTDEKILSNEKIETSNGMLTIEYGWYSFIKEQGVQQTDLYDFIAALSASNIIKQALFYVGKSVTDYSDLHIYLDSPIIFALLGMAEEARTESYKKLVDDMLKVRCNIHVFDHNFQEVDGIIARAASWANNNQYDLRKANNAARFFHDSQMSDIEIANFCATIEDKLNKLGITIKETSYDVIQNDFQEDETCLFDMVEERYFEHGCELSADKEESIRIDVRSIVMIYRERQGQTATRVQKAKHIMLTSNNAIANVSKKYESNQSTQSGHIPACISADLFGTILWLDSPMQILEYQKQKLLADCYAFLKPDKALLNAYIQSLEQARNEDIIDEKRFLFLRTHKVVLDSLMDITQGDYARFHSNTYLEVYEDIEARAQKKYKDEAFAHKQTHEELKNLKKSFDEEVQKNNQEKKELNDEIAFWKKKEKERQEKVFNRNVTILGWIFTFFFVAIPYLVAMVGIEMLRIQFSDVTLYSACCIAGFIIVTGIVTKLYSIGKKKCFEQARKLLRKKDNIPPN